MTLIVRPIPVVGEDWASYLRACARNNGFADAEHLAFSANVRTTTLQSPSLGKQARALGIDPCQESEHSDGAFIPVLPLYERVCPRCLRGGMHRTPSHWNQPLTIACRVHRVFLIDVCPSCESALNKFRRRAHRCACGFDLRRAVTEPATDTALSLGSQFIDANLLDEAGTFSLPLQAALRLSERLRLVSSILGVGSASRAWPWVLELRECLIWLEEWPFGFLEHAKRYLADSRTRSARHLPLQKLAGARPGPFRDVVLPLLKGLHQKLAALELELIRARVRTAKATNLSMDALYQRIRAAQKAEGREFSLQECVEYLDMHASAGRMYRINVLRSMYGGSRLLWIELRNNQVLEPFIPYFATSKSAHEQAVQEFLAKLRALSTPRPRRPARTVPYDKFAVGNRKYPWSSFDLKMQAIEDRVIPLFKRSGKRGKSFDDFEVDLESSGAWKDKLGRKLGGYAPQCS